MENEYKSMNELIEENKRLGKKIKQLESCNEMMKVCNDECLDCGLKGKNCHCSTDMYKDWEKNG